jgi:replicative DNA helicase
MDSTNYGKIPPQSIDMEKAVLGAIMLEKHAILTVGTFLKSEMFYSPSHQKIYESVINLSLTGSPIDLLTITEYLRKKDELDLVGGPFYITELCTKISSAANIEYHAKIIEQKYIQREVIRISSIYIEKGYDDATDVSDLIDNFTLEMMNINKGSIKQVQQIGEAVEKSIDYLFDVMAGKVQPFGIRTLINKIDKKTNGLQKGVTIIAARPGMGKSSLVLQFVNNIAVDQEIPTAFFEMEMFEPQFVRWLQSQRTGIDNERLKMPFGKLSPEEINLIEKESYKIKHAPLYVDFTPAINIIQLRSKAIQLVHQHGIKLIIIDYLQLMSNAGRYQNREGEVSEISRGIRELSKELDLPIIALSQINRQNENRSNKKPTLSDLRESGAIEQDADTVIFIHRPEKYGFTEDENGNSLIGVIELIYAKNRDGDNESVKIFFDGSRLTFSDEKPQNIDFSNPNEFIESTNEF